MYIIKAHVYSCWITPDRGTNWAFHGPVIAVLLVSVMAQSVLGPQTQFVLYPYRLSMWLCLLQINIVILVYVVTVIVRLTRRKEDDACLFM